MSLGTGERALMILGGLAMAALVVAVLLKRIDMSL